MPTGPTYFAALFVLLSVAAQITGAPIISAVLAFLGGVFLNTRLTLNIHPA